MFHARASGADLHAPSNQLVKNETGTYIPKGTVVKVAGVLSDGTPIVEPVTSDSDVPFGALWEDILNDRLGLACVLGIFPYSSTGTIGEKLYFTATGQLTTNFTSSFVVGKILNNEYVQLNFMSVDMDSSDWDTRGNTLENDESKLGSLNNKDVSIVTNGQVRTFYSKNGNIRHGDTEIVPDFRYQFSNSISHHSGVLLDNFSATNGLASFLVIWSHEIPEFTLQTFNVHLVAKKDNKKAVFDYTVTVSRESGLAVVHHVQTDYQIKIGEPSFRCKFSVNLTNFRVEVSNSTDLGAIWSGYILSHAIV